MGPDLVFNEISASPAATSAVKGRERADELVRTLRAAIDAGCARRLHIKSDFHGVTLAQDFSIGMWLAERAADRESRHYLLILTTSAAFLDSNDHPALQAAGATKEVLYCGQSATGLLVAHLCAALAVSVQSGDEWNETVLCVTERTLGAGGEVTDLQVKVHHANDMTAIAHHETWICEQVGEHLPSGDLVWRNRQTCFPRLEFCPRTNGQLNAIPRGDPAIGQIVARLLEMDRFCRGWQSRQHEFDPKLIQNCSPESKKTLEDGYLKNRHTFADAGGVGHVFSWHVRFTPGAGRIYFTPRYTTRLILIGHIGNKLPTELYPT